MIYNEESQLSPNLYAFLPKTIFFCMKEKALNTTLITTKYHTMNIVPTNIFTLVFAANRLLTNNKINSKIILKK